MSQSERYSLVLATPLPGALRLGVRIDTGHVVSIDFLPEAVQIHTGNTPSLQRMAQQLLDYFEVPSSVFSVTLQPAGTPYQQRVWHALQQIPSGEVLTYGALAAQLQSSPRAVAAACRANPIPLLIPCHRVVARNGLGGYMGATQGESLALKEWLLRHEGAL